MVNFPIEFKYQGKRYTATVHRIASGSLQYHVSNISPSDHLIPDPFIFSVVTKEPSNEFQFPLDPDEYPLQFGGAVANAILNACNERNIPWDDQNYKD